LSARASAFSESERTVPPSGEQEGRLSRNSHHPPGHPPQRLVFRVEGFECSAPMVVSPLVELAGHRPLQEIDFGFQGGVPGELLLPPQPVLRLSHLECRPVSEAWVVMRVTLGS